MPSRIRISDEDIQEIGVEFNCDFSDDSRRQALLCTTGMDVQACPGSGKTTLLVAKLAILAKRWRWKDRGVLVLSHTNVARREVEDRLGRHPHGHRLLSYPHFVGTIQTFVDTFLALPYLKSQGQNVMTVDNAVFAEKSRAYAEARRGEFYWFHQSPYQRMGFLGKARFEFEDGRLAVGCADRNFNLGRDTQSYKAMEAMKRNLHEQGLFRFDDMFALSEKYAYDAPWVVCAVTQRFPWVFVDEMQDTTDTADRLIMLLFADGCILQRFGDANQGIFHGEGDEKGQSSFPAEGRCIDLRQSKRFGCTIGHLCSPVSAVYPQFLDGDTSLPDRRNTIILFHKDSILEVIPTFGRLINEEFGPATSVQVRAKAVGFRRRPRKTPNGKDLPHDIGDYWPHFDSAFTRDLGGETCLLEYIAKARSVVAATGECREAYSVIIGGLLRLAAELQLTGRDGGRVTKSDLLRSVAGAPSEIRKRYDAMMHNLCMGGIPLREDTWLTMGKDAVELTMQLFTVGKPADAANFLKWSDGFDVPPEVENANIPDRRNIYRHQIDSFQCDIELMTIHAVKGETHDATLVLETCFKRGHDIKKALPFLACNDNVCAAADCNTQEHLKRLYVAMTRPRELLCIALLKDHLGSNKKQRRERTAMLQDKGWRLLDLTEGDQDE